MTPTDTSLSSMFFVKSSRILLNRLGMLLGLGYLEQIEDGRDSQNSSRTGRSAHVIEYVGLTE